MGKLALTMGELNLTMGNSDLAMAKPHLAMAKPHLAMAKPALTMGRPPCKSSFDPRRLTHPERCTVSPLLGTDLSTWWAIPTPSGFFTTSQIVTISANACKLLKNNDLNSALGMAQAVPLRNA